MKILRCSSCGASLNPNKEDKITKCPYCGSKYLTEETTSYQKESNEENTTVNKTKITSSTPQKLKINVGLLIVLLILFPLAGFAYLVISLLVQNNQNKNTNQINIEEMDEIDDIDEND